MESRKERQGERGTEGSPTVNYIYGLSFQGCTFHDTTFQTLAQEAKDVKNVKVSESESERNMRSSPSPVFTTEEAKKLLVKFQCANMLNEKWYPLGLTNSEKGILAWFLAGKLNIPNQWQVFGHLWSMKSETLRSAYNKAMDQKKTKDFLDKLKHIVND